MKFNVKSLRVEKIMTYDNREELYYDNLMYVLNCIADGDNYEIRLWEENGDCYSGWTSASWSFIDVRKVDTFIGMTHKPIKHELSFDLDGEIEGDIFIVRYPRYVSNDIFSSNYDGGDYWYPGGVLTFNMSLFEEIPRNLPKRPVWIFKGDSCLGKSYLAGIIGNSDRFKSVYETDAHEKLSDIHEDIIVLGNKYKHSIEDIESHILGEHDTILVEFSSSK